jgi:predicted RNA-binding Zn ribbon-like protein
VPTTPHRHLERIGKKHNLPKVTNAVTFSVGEREPQRPKEVELVRHRPPAIFVADAPGLDFLNSVATPTDKVIDWIDDGDGLLNWLDQAQLVPAEVLATVTASAHPGELDKVADQARALREWFRGFVRDHRGRPLTVKDLRELEPLNQLLESDEPFAQIAPHSHGGHGALELKTIRRWRSPESLLLPIGEALARFVCDTDFTNVKACEGPTCTLMFADHTRGRARRWCSMAICGNRAKQAAHRSRLKARH